MLLLIDIIAYYCVDLEAIIIDFLGCFITNISYAPKDLDTIIANRLANWHWKAVDN